MKPIFSYLQVPIFHRTSLLFVGLLATLVMLACFNVQSEMFQSSEDLYDRLKQCEKLSPSKALIQEEVRLSTKITCKPTNHVDAGNVDFSAVATHGKEIKELGHGFIKTVFLAELCGIPVALARRKCDVKKELGIEFTLKEKNKAFPYFDDSLVWMKRVQGHPRHFPVLLAVCEEDDDSEENSGYKYKSFVSKLENTKEYHKFRPRNRNYHFVNPNTRNTWQYNANDTSEVEREKNENLMTFAIRLEIAIDYAHAIANLHNNIYEPELENGIEVLKHKPNFENKTFIYCDHKDKNIVIDKSLQVKILDLEMITCINCPDSINITCNEFEEDLKKFKINPDDNEEKVYFGKNDTRFDMWHWQDIVTKNTFTNSSGFVPPEAALVIDEIMEMLPLTNWREPTSFQVYQKLKAVQDQLQLKVSLVNEQ